MPLAALAVGAALNCWVLAEQRFKVPAYLLYAVASVESSYDPTALAYAHDGTYSVGLMQINSRWFPALARVGIAEKQLYQPCTNVQVGAWILAQEVTRYGCTWQAIGSYYAGPFDERSRDRKQSAYRKYADKVLQRWRMALNGEIRIGHPASRRARHLHHATPGE